MKRRIQTISETRELTDKELREITRDMGRGIRLQSGLVSKIVQANLKAAFADRRQQASQLLRSKKTVAA